MKTIENLYQEAEKVRKSIREMIDFEIEIDSYFSELEKQNYVLLHVEEAIGAFLLYVKKEADAGTREALSNGYKKITVDKIEKYVCDIDNISKNSVFMDM
jgi:hypothetical protein